MFIATWSAGVRTRKGDDGEATIDVLFLVGAGEPELGDESPMSYLVAARGPLRMGRSIRRSQSSSGAAMRARENADKVLTSSARYLTVG